jgi:hypothetical protein
MKCKQRFIKFLAVLMLAFAAVNLGLTTMNERETTQHISYGIPHENASFAVSEFNRTSNPLAYLFQILFILFIISPPLIVILLFLIWKELKARNNLK